MVNTINPHNTSFLFGTLARYFVQGSNNRGQRITQGQSKNCVLIKVSNALWYLFSPVGTRPMAICLL